MTAGAEIVDLDEARRERAAFFDEVRRRTDLNLRCLIDRWLLMQTREVCRRDVVLWVNNFAWTFDPRPRERKVMPFTLWPAQEDFLRWLEEREERREEGVCVKSRDVGVTWLCVAFAVHRWLFYPHYDVTFGSDKADKVDILDNLRTILPKARLLIEMLPSWMRPVGFDRSRHSLHMRIVNPETGASITGECGDQIGRGGRSSIAFLDEAAFIERAIRSYSALSANTEVLISVSTPNRPDDEFARRAQDLQPGRVRIDMRWEDDPRRDQAWADRERALLGDQVWAREYGRDFKAAVEGLVLPGHWIDAAAELYRRLDGKWDHGPTVAGLDIGGGKAESVFAPRRGPMVFPPVAWGRPDTTDTAYRSLDEALGHDVERMMFDAPAIGAGVQSALMRREGDYLKVTVVPVNTGEPAPEYVRMPDKRTAKETFANLKAFLWWSVRDRFRMTYEHIAEDVDHDLADLIAIPPDLKLHAQLNQPTWTRTLSGKIAIDKMPAGTPSPDRGDAMVLAFHEPPLATWKPGQAAVVGSRLAGTEADW